MAITPNQIRQLAPKVDGHIANGLAEALNREMPRFGITDALGRAHFLAQACHESGGLTRFVENLNYTTPQRIAAIWPRLAGRAHELVRNPSALANAAYANRLGNGSEQSGDGFKFRGRGLFQLTGRDSYTRAAQDLGQPYLVQPDLVASPAGAVLTALWFWKQNRCGAAAARDDVKAVTRIINGPGMVGLQDRIHLTAKAKEIFR